VSATDVSIRPAKAGDESKLREIDNEAWAVDNSPGPLAAADAPFFTQTTAIDDVIVAELEGELAGYVKLRRPTALASNRHVFEINGLAVARARRRRGVARALLRAAETEARERGARKLRLRVLGDNGAARALYESEGYVVSGILPEEFLLDGRFVDDVWMTRDLAADAGQA
jgi:ribosomal protein S18 acetylase RimI-like enzyme